MHGRMHSYKTIRACVHHLYLLYACHDTTFLASHCSAVPVIYACEHAYFCSRKNAHSRAHTHIILMYIHAPTTTPSERERESNTYIHTCTHAKYIPSSLWALLVGKRHGSGTQCSCRSSAVSLRSKQYRYVQGNKNDAVWLMICDATVGKRIPTNTWLYQCLSPHLPPLSILPFPTQHSLTLQLPALNLSGCARFEDRVMWFKAASWPT